MKLNHKATWMIVSAALMAMTQIAHAAQYTVTKFSYGFKDSSVFAINAHGDVVGNTTDQLDGSVTHGDSVIYTPFRSVGGILMPMDTTDSVTGTAYAVNDFGQTVGTYSSTSHGRGAFFSDGGVLTNLGSLSGAYGINNAGQIVGWGTLLVGSTYQYHAFLYSNRTPHDLGTLGGSTSYAYGINSSGQIVGESKIAGDGHSHAFSDVNGIMTDLGTLPGTSESAARAINDAGTIVGTSGDHAFRYANGVMTDLGMLPGSSNSGALGLNSMGDIVGWSTGTSAQYYAPHGILIHNGVMVDLNNAINPALNLLITRAYGINDSGSIVATVSRYSTCGILLTPNVTIAGVPGTPTALVAGAVAPTEIDLRWYPVRGATSYAIYRSATPGGTRALVGTVSDITNFNDITAKDQSTSYYVVVASNAAGSGPVSAQVSATTPVAIPAIPTNVKAVGISSSEIKISWDAVPKATGYTVVQIRTEYEPGNGDTQQYVTLGTTTATNFTATGLPSSTPQTFVVIAYNASGASYYSDDAIGTTLAGIPDKTTITTAVGVSASQIQVTWNAVPGASQYKILRSPVNAGVYATVGTSTTTTYTDNHLSPYTYYDYVVVATNSLGDGPQSNRFSAPTWIAPPTNVTATAISANQINVSWNPVNGAQSYHIYAAALSGDYSGPVATTDANTLTYSHTGLNSATRYYFVVSAVGLGESKSAEVSATTKPGVPSAPGLRISHGTYATVTLTWSASPGAVSYRVYRSAAPASAHLSIGTTTTTEFVDTVPQPGAKYYYVVTATNSFGTSPKSNEVIFQPYSPDPPTQFTATPVSASQIDLTWTAGAGATSYKIYRSPAPSGYGPDGILIHNTGATHLSDTGLSASTKYTYTIYSVIGSDPYYAPTSTGTKASATTFGPPPGALTGLTATPVSASQIKLTWNAVAGATGYRIFSSTSAITYHTSIGQTAGTSFTHTGLAGGTTHYYFVVPFNGPSYGPKSAEVFAKTFTTPNALSNLKATAVSRSQINLSWSAATGATGYSIFRSSAKGAYHSYIGTTTSTSFANTGLTAGTTYYYVVVPTNASGSGPKSAEVSAKTSALPNAPTNVMATTISKSQIKVTWTAAAGATSYYVFRGTVHNGQHNYIAATSATSYSNSGLAANTTYYYIVVGVNSSGQGPKSNEAAATTPAH